MVDAGYDGERLMANVNALIKEKGLKIGDVESAIGISAGYLGRLTKRGSEASPSIELVWKLAQYFDVSVEALLVRDPGRPKDNAELVAGFLSELCIDTELGDMDWQVVTTEEINQSLIEGVDDYPFIVQRSGREKEFPEIKLTAPGYSYLSMRNAQVYCLGLGGGPVSVFGNAYWARFDDNNIIWLVPIAFGDELINHISPFVINSSFPSERCVEVYIEADGASEEERVGYALLSTMDCPEKIAETTNRLYKMVEKTQGGMRLDLRAKYIIQDFMSNRRRGEKRMEDNPGVSDEGESFEASEEPGRPPGVPGG